MIVDRHPQFRCRSGSDFPFWCRSGSWPHPKFYTCKKIWKFVHCNSQQSPVWTVLEFSGRKYSFSLHLVEKVLKWIRIRGPQRLRFMLHCTVCLNWNINKSKRVACSHQTNKKEKKEKKLIFFYLCGRWGVGRAWCDSAWQTWRPKRNWRPSLLNRSTNRYLYIMYLSEHPRDEYINLLAHSCGFAIGQ